MRLVGACLCVRAGVVKQNQEILSCGSERRGPGVGARAQGECVCVRVKGGTRNLARGPPGFCVWLGLCAAFARARFGRSLWGCQGRASAGGCACVRVCETKVCLFFFLLHASFPPSPPLFFSSFRHAHPRPGLHPRSRSLAKRASSLYTPLRVHCLHCLARERGGEGERRAEAKRDCSARPGNGAALLPAQGSLMHARAHPFTRAFPPPLHR